MKIKRFSAASMREAMRQVREQQGPDAVILSSHRVTGGVEVVAAIDYDEALIREALKVPKSKPRPSEVAASQAEVSKITWSQDPALQALSRELMGMRRLIEAQAETRRDSEVNRDPQRARTLRMMEGLGFAHDIAREVSLELPDGTDEARARYLPLGWLSRRIPVLSKDPLAQPGVLALVGPTGVGKTTTLAKLAARAVKRYGRRSVVLMTLDTYRVSAQEQLSYYGRLLGVPVSVIGPQDNLSNSLARVADCPVVLLDTAGISPRDARLHGQLERLAQCGKVRSMLVMPANGQLGDLETAAGRFSEVKPFASILTKVDETHRLGESLSVVIRRKLPVAFITDGQRVPEDLHPARAPDLTVRAVHSARQPDDRPEGMQRSQEAVTNG
tara:strand:+ start:7234 stop:8394 length:1161 start_codon:yes stop_codon:yes gene_type:complete